MKISRNMIIGMTIIISIAIVVYTLYSGYELRESFLKQIRLEAFEQLENNEIAKTINHNEPDYSGSSYLLPPPVSTNINTQQTNKAPSSEIDSTTHISRDEFNQFKKGLINSKCPPCPPCARCPESSFECKKVPNYSVVDNSFLPSHTSEYTTYGM